MDIFAFLQQSEHVKTYAPSPEDGKFAVDLLHSLQNNAPLTLLQKIFLIFDISIPGSLSWKLSLFEHLYSFSFASVLTTVIGGLFVIMVLYLIKRFALCLFLKKEPVVFLELAFPSMTSKTAYATEQLFTLLHTLAEQRKFIQRVVGYKKEYSLEIVATREEGIRYILAVSDNDAPIIQKSLLSFMPGLKINQIMDYLPTDLKEKNKGKDRGKEDKLGVIELSLAHDFALPLKKLKTLDEHDPIAYLTDNMTKLKPNEVMVFQIVATPLTRSAHRQIVKHIFLIKQKIYANRPLADELFRDPLEKALSIPIAVIRGILLAVYFSLNFILSIFTIIWENKPIVSERKVQVLDPKQEILNPYEQQLQVEVKEKIDQPMFETSLRLLVCSDSSTEYHLRVSGFMASLGSLGTTYQSLILKTKSLFTLIFPPLSAFATRRVSFAVNPILSVSELTDIYHFPYTETTKTEDMVKTKNQPLPAPLSFKQTSTRFDNVFAKNSYGGSETVIGQTLEERRRHTYILGATGSGKTTLLSTMIYQDIINGKGVAVLDPHGQLVEKLLQVIPKERIKDVVWFAPDDDAYPIALNLLDLSKDSSFTSSQVQKQKSLIASSIISIIEKFYDAKFFGPRMEYVLRNTILTALETPNPTLLTIMDILTKSSYRKDIVKGLKNQVLKDYWINEFEKLGNLQRNNVISPITNKIGGLLSSPINYNILSQEKSKLDFDEIINSGKILLCDLSKGKIGEDESSFFGSLVIAKIQLAALRRALIPEEKRKDFYLYVDEFQNFATPTFAELVSEARKYRLSTILAHQSVSQIENRDIVKVILANVGTVICFKTANPEDEQFILPIFSPEVLKHEIGNLPLYNFYMKISVGQAEDSFLAETDNFTVKGIERTAELVINMSRKNYASPFEAEESLPIDTKSISDKKTRQTQKKNMPRKSAHSVRRKPDKSGM